MKNRIYKRLLSLLLVIVMLLTSVPLAVYAADEVTTTVDLNEYIVFDLAASKVIFKSTTYSGSQYIKNADGEWELQNVSGLPRTATDKYYVFQSTTKESVEISGDTLILKSYDIDNNLIINNPDVEQVIEDWAAAAIGRKPTNNYIRFDTSTMPADITIDDIWSTHKSTGQGFIAESSNKANGGINIQISGSSTNMLVTLRLRGDNRLSNFTYYCSSNTQGEGLVVCDDTTDTGIGSLTVIGNPKAISAADYGSAYINGAAENNWNSVFGGTDSASEVYNLSFISGVVYAGANKLENCTAIGAGGNGFGEIYVSGTAVVTAVSHSTGTAIGGGIAHTGTGGAGYVNISGSSKVYAYNFGLNAYDRVRSNQYGTTDKTVIANSKHIPGTAIGGASSIKQAGQLGTVDIEGDTNCEVYAWSLGGAGLGGGNTIGYSNYKGGDAKINIVSGNVTAVSASDTLEFNDGTTYAVKEGSAIGGGNSVYGVGGTATVNISGGLVVANGIGGGNSTNKSGGTATVKVTGGNITNTGGIGGGNSTKDAGGDAEVTILNGIISNTGVIGGGNSINSVGGNAEVTIKGGSISAGGIGGGSSVEADGGNATVFIEKGIVDNNGTIGGGDSEKAYGGDATVIMNGGTVVSEGIGGGFSTAKGYADGSVTVNGGSLNSSMAAVPVNDRGDVLYLTRITFFYNTDTMINTKVERLDIRPVDVSYYQTDIYTDEIGMIYLWLPMESLVTFGKLAGGSDTDTYYAKNEADRDIDANDVGALICESDKPRYIVTVAGGSAYSLYLDQSMHNPLSGSAIVEQGIFTYYVSLNPGYKLTPYIGTVLADGSKVITVMADALQPVEGTPNLNVGAVYVQRDTPVWFLLEDTTTNTSYFNCDLSSGDIVITEDSDGKISIEQNGYKFSGYYGNIYLTSAGYPTANSVTIRSERDKSSSSINILANDLNVNSVDAAINVESGNVSLQFGDKDNLINSISDSPIKISEDAVLNLKSEDGNSIKIKATDTKTPLILGAGTLNLDNKGGFLNVQIPEEGTSQIAVGSFNFEGENDEFTAELYRGEYSFTVIGFMQDDKLHSLIESPDSEKIFSARGIVERYNGILRADDALVVENDTLTITLKADKANNMKEIGLLKISDENGNDITNSLSIEYSTDNSTVTISIDGSSFLGGNLIIDAAADKLISYTAMSQVEVYDGNPHGIFVQVEESLFKVRYDTKAINSPTEGQGTNPLFVDVGTYEVFFYIYSENGGYTPVTGSAQIQITPGTNEWLNTLECPNIICGNEPKAYAKSKWGDVKYEYFYSENDEKIELGDFANITEETEFYVVATVDGTSNYAELLSKKIYFRAMMLSGYTQSGRQLDKIQTGETDTLTIANEGVFSVYFKGQSIGESSNLTFDNVLPVGTKVTFMTMTQDTVTYYYYNVSEDDVQGGQTVLALNKFILMGGESDQRFAPQGINESVEYQFCIDYKGLSTNREISICLNNNHDTLPKVVRQLSWLEQIDEITSSLDQTMTKIDVVTSEKSFSITVKPNIAGTGYKYLALQIRGKYQPLSGGEEKVFTLVNMDTSLSVVMDNSLSEKMEPIAATEDYLLYRIGLPSDTSINQNVTIVISNVEAGNYDLDIVADVRMSEKKITDFYALQGLDEENRAELKGVEFTIRDQVLLRVQEISDKHLITAGDTTLNFSIYKENADDIPVMLSIFKKENGVYRSISLPGGATAIPITSSNPSISTDRFNIDNGTYRLVFSCGDAVCVYNIIVQK